ncbi:MAG TPA: non-homologous end-joining DNA ligase [Acidimicrobiia bacterium]|nr:non-homologous end-joining DNA ligase [Acidimicrobiia bacterium]
MTDSAYDRKRRFEDTPEPPPQVAGEDVDPATAPAGTLFVIQQHYATRLHHDLRLEMYHGDTPVLVSWAIPKRLPGRSGPKHLAIRTEDHPIEYATFTGSIPEGNYGAGEVRMFDTGTYEIVEREGKKLTVQLEGERVRGIYHLVHFEDQEGKQQWLAMLSRDLRPPPDPKPAASPMLATTTAHAFDDPGWTFEPKWDGIRAIAVCGESTILISRNDNDITGGYPELQALHDRLVAFEAMLDGEIVAFEAGKPSFQRLQSRMHVRDRGQLDLAVKTNPVTFIAFDLLYLDGHSLIAQPLEQRRQLLEATLVGYDRVQISPAVIGEGRALFTAAAEQDLEGVVAKRLGSRYEPGRRSSSWLKIKTVLEADVVVVGWSEGGGARRSKLGSLVMALYEGDQLRYAGNVGTGFTEQSLEEVVGRLRSLGEGANPFPPKLMAERPELRRAHWVPPLLVAKVEYRQVTAAGRLRAPSFQGLREDKAPAECTIDQLTVKPAP